VRITLIDRDVPSYFKSLEHLLRYCARPPFALERLSVRCGEDGRATRVRYLLPRRKAANWVGSWRGRKTTRPGNLSGVARRAAPDRHPQPLTAFHATVRPARRAVSRPVYVNETNPALSVDRKHLGADSRGTQAVRWGRRSTPDRTARRALGRDRDSRANGF